MGDMSESEEVLASDCALKDLNLVNSTFVPPQQKADTDGIAPVRLRHFTGVDFTFPTEQCKDFTDDFSSLESMNLDWRKTSSDLVEFLHEQGSNLTSLKKFAYHEQSSGPQPVFTFPIKEQKLDKLE